MVSKKTSIRIGSGAGYAGDRLEPALELIRSGQLDYIGFECLAERTIALAQIEKQKHSDRGYNPLLKYRMEKVLPLAYNNKVKVITNMGAANPEMAGILCAEIARRNNLKHLKIASVSGDDIFENISNYHDQAILETGEKLHSIADSIISANAYLGIAPIIEALESDADVIITGRVADPALFLAPMVHEFGWSLNDFDKIGKGTMIGHLLECAGQVSGGYFADPGHKNVPELWNLGFPYVEVDHKGNGIISKVSGTGGRIDKATCTEQLLYEIHDPKRYLTPDCTADFSKVDFTREDVDRIRFTGATGNEPPETLKVSVGYKNGYLGEGEISYAGHQCIERAQLAGEIISKRLSESSIPITDITIDLIGLNSVNPNPVNIKQAPEVRLRVAGKCMSEEAAQIIGNEVEALYTNGPYGGSGATKKTSSLVSIASILVPRSEINTEIIYHSI